MFGKAKGATGPTGPAYRRSYKAKIKIYRDSKGEFRWRLLATNGKIMADSGESYTDRQHCKEAVERFRNAAFSASIVDSSEALK